MVNKLKLNQIIAMYSQRMTVTKIVERRGEESHDIAFNSKNLSIFCR